MAYSVKPDQTAPLVHKFLIPVYNQVYKMFLNDIGPSKGDYWIKH